MEKKQLNIHTPIHHYFPEMGNSVAIQKKDITLFHLLTMTSGLKVVNFQASKNWVTSILNQPVINEPGSTFEYNSGNSHLLSAIIQKVSGETTASFAVENLFKPLGIHKYIWVADPQGIHGGGFSLSIHIEDMMKIGKVLLDEGVYMGKRVISPNWISESQTLYKQVSESEYGTYGYGYQFWIAKSSNHPNYFYANGIYGQNIFIVPKLNLVAAVKGQLDSKNQSLPNSYFEAFLREYVTKN
ncbi:serine hydrolase [Bacillus sp. Bva_UNVM-123]|uniref:serine hydrolase domain-containing protein n=1 Tax=Bacillus sp. Bva_UNVM-123 TaxID=2829798 RepID=UPI00391EF2CE